MTSDVSRNLGPFWVDVHDSDFPKVMVRVASRTVMVKLFTRTYCG